MTTCNMISMELILKKYKLNISNKTVFSIIGVIAESKGVDFIISCFMYLNLNNVILLVVGSGPKDYL